MRKAPIESQITGSHPGQNDHIDLNFERPLRTIHSSSWLATVKKFIQIHLKAEIERLGRRLLTRSGAVERMLHWWKMYNVFQTSPYHLNHAIPISIEIQKKLYYIKCNQKMSLRKDQNTFNSGLDASRKSCAETVHRCSQYLGVWINFLLIK